MNVEEILAQYTPRTMISAMTQGTRPVTFLLDMFGGNVLEHDTEIIEIDIVKGGRTVAAYVSREGDPTPVEKRGYGTNLHWTPYVNETIPFTMKDIKKRLPSGTVYDSGPASRLDVKIGEWLGDLNDRFTRLKEKQVAEVLQTGKLTITGKDVNYIVDYQMNANHLPVNATSDNWGTGTEDKIQQIEDDAQLIRETGSASPTILILDKLAARDWMNDPEVLKYMDNRRVDLGEIKPRQLADMNATYLGRFSRIGLDVDVYSYQGTYDNAAGVAVGYMNDNTYILTNPNARFIMHYGLIENFESTFIGQSFPSMEIEKKKGSINLESAPMFAAHQPDAIVTRKTKTV